MHAMLPIRLVLPLILRGLGIAWRVALIFPTARALDAVGFDHREEERLVVVVLFAIDEFDIKVEFGREARTRNSVETNILLDKGHDRFVPRAQVVPRGATASVQNDLFLATMFSSPKKLSTSFPMSAVDKPVGVTAAGILNASVRLPAPRHAATIWVFVMPFDVPILLTREAAPNSFGCDVSSLPALRKAMTSATFSASSFDA